MKRGRRVSVVVPAYNEATNLPALVERVTRVLATLPYEGELIVVDDGSRDDTGEVLDELCGRYPGLGVVRFSRNFGHQAALSAGLDHATGDAVILMDADLQHPPEAIPDLVHRWEEGFDIVQGAREADAPRGVMKRLTSTGFYRVLNWLSEVPIDPDSPDFRLMDRKAVDALAGMRERTRFLRGMTSWIGFPRATVTYHESDRLHGQPKFSARRMLRLAADALVSMSTVPLRVGLVAGVVATLVGLVYAAWVVGAWALADRSPTLASGILLAVLFLGGLQLAVTGILGLYLGRVYEEVKQRPLYVVRKRGGVCRAEDPREG